MHSCRKRQTVPQKNAVHSSVLLLLLLLQLPNQLTIQCASLLIGQFKSLSAVFFFPFHFTSFHLPFALTTTASQYCLLSLTILSSSKSFFLHFNGLDTAPNAIIRQLMRLCLIKVHTLTTVRMVVKWFSTWVSVQCCAQRRRVFTLLWETVDGSSWSNFHRLFADELHEQTKAEAASAVEHCALLDSLLHLRWHFQRMLIRKDAHTHTQFH